MSTFGAVSAVPTSRERAFTLHCARRVALPQDKTIQRNVEKATAGSAR
jgi:hypothetical protein